jgi:hypothetical protein
VRVETSDIRMLRFIAGHDIDQHLFVLGHVRLRLEVHNDCHRVIFVKQEAIIVISEDMLMPISFCVQ